MSNRNPFRDTDANQKKQDALSVRNEMIEKAAKLDAKWLAQEKRSVKRLFHLKRLFSMLQEEKDLGTCPSSPHPSQLSL